MLAHELAMLDAEEEEEEPTPDNFHFKCPAQTCNGLFGADDPYNVFVSHVSEHAHELYEMNLHPCYFGCPEGFVDEIQLRRHVSNCRSYASLPMTSKGETECSAPDCSFTGNEHARHWSYTHGSGAYLDVSTPYRDEVCQLGWTDPHLFYTHIINGMKTSCSHITRLFGAWDPSKFIVYRVPFTAPQDFTGIPKGDILQTVVRPTADSWLVPESRVESLTSVELARLWILRMSAQPLIVVQYPEQCTNGDVCVWRIPDFGPQAFDLVDHYDELLSPSPPPSQPLAASCKEVSTQKLRWLYSVATNRHRLHLIFIYRHSEGH
jgi:hypothetical protein